MKPVLIVLLILFALAGLYLLSLRGRKGHPGLSALRDWSYAHRGFHGEGRPENSMAAFRAAVRQGYGIELDVHLLRDGTLAVIHDSELKRTTGGEGRIEDLTAEELDRYYLENTLETIPSFSQVLELVDGRTPLIVELKPLIGNYKALCAAVCAQLDTYSGPYCIESFDPRCILWLKKHRPEIIRGLLARNFLATKEPLPWILKWLLSLQLLNFLSLPDFVAFRFQDRKTLGNYLVRRLWGVQGVSWTIKTPEVYDEVVQEGWIPIFEQFAP